MDREYIENDRHRRPRRDDGNRPRKKKKKKKKRNGPPPAPGAGRGRRNKDREPLSALAQNSSGYNQPRQGGGGYGGYGGYGGSTGGGPPPPRGGGFANYETMESDGFSGAIGGPPSSFQTMEQGQQEYGNYGKRELFDDSFNQNETDEGGFIPGSRAVEKKRRFGRPKVGRPKVGMPKIGMPKVPKIGVPKIALPKVGLPKLGKREPRMPLPPEGEFDDGFGFGDRGGGGGFGGDDYGYKGERGGRNDREYADDYGSDGGYGYGQRKGGKKKGREQNVFTDDYGNDGRSPAPAFDERRGVYQLEGGDLPRKFGCTIQCYCNLPTPIARLRQRFCG